MMHNKEKLETKQAVMPAVGPYKRPELKKHGKLKNKASQTTIYTYYYIT